MLSLRLTFCKLFQISVWFYVFKYLSVNVINWCKNESMYSNQFLSLFCMIADMAADVIVVTGKINILFLVLSTTEMSNSIKHQTISV